MLASYEIEVIHFASFTLHFNVGDKERCSALDACLSKEPPAHKCISPNSEKGATVWFPIGVPEWSREIDEFPLYANTSASSIDNVKETAKVERVYVFASNTRSRMQDGWCELCEVLFFKQITLISLGIDDSSLFTDIAIVLLWSDSAECFEEYDRKQWAFVFEAW